MTSTKKTTVQSTPRSDRATLAAIETLILRITNGHVEVADVSVEGGIPWRDATDDEREAFGERLWEGI